MTGLAGLREAAIIGWLDVLAGRPGGGERFNLTGRGLARVGIGVSVAFAVLAIAVLVVPPIGLYMVTMPAIPAS